MFQLIARHLLHTLNIIVVESFTTPHHYCPMSVQPLPALTVTILKRERYYGRRFTCKRELVQMIETYIHYYNTRRVQRNLGVLTPMEKHELALAA